jgi:phosphonate transport system substrate-binding protein
VPKDLQGKLIAFEEPYSTGSYYLPKASLKSLGMDFIENNPSIILDDEQIKYKFTGDDINTIVWVLSKRVHAGAMSSNSFNLLAANQRSKLRVIHSTIDVPRHIVSIRNDLDPVLAFKIRNILLQMHKSENGRKVLQKFKKTAKFDEFPDGADMAIESLNKLNTFFRINQE